MFNRSNIFVKRVRLYETSDSYAEIEQIEYLTVGKGDFE
jgi:hypothetical protein